MPRKVEIHPLRTHRHRGTDSGPLNSQSWAPRELATPTLHSLLLKFLHSKPWSAGIQTSQQPIHVSESYGGEMKLAVLQKPPKLQLSQGVSVVRRMTAAWDTVEVVGFSQFWNMPQHSQFYLNKAGYVFSIISKQAEISLYWSCNWADNYLTSHLKRAYPWLSVQKSITQK